MSIGVTSAIVIPKRQIIPQKASKPAFQSQPATEYSPANEKKKFDLESYPMRACAHLHAITETFVEPVTHNPYLIAAGYAIPFMYMGAVVHDKAREGERGVYTKESVKTVVKETTFQLLSSIFFTTGASVLGRKTAVKALTAIKKGKVPEKQKIAAEMLGSFTALALLIHPIEKYTHEWIIKKGLEPALDEKNQQEFLNKYVKNNPFLSGLAKSPLLGQYQKESQPASPVA